MRTECKRDHAARARTKEREVTTTQLWKVGILTTRKDRTYSPCRARTGARGTAIQRACANLGGHTILRVCARTYARWERSTWTVRPGSGASSFHHCYRHFESDASGKKIRFNSPIKWSIYGRMGQNSQMLVVNRVFLSLFRMYRGALNPYFVSEPNLYAFLILILIKIRNSVECEYYYILCYICTWRYPVL